MPNILQDLGKRYGEWTQWQRKQFPQAEPAPMPENLLGALGAIPRATYDPAYGNLLATVDPAMVAQTRVRIPPKTLGGNIMKRHGRMSIIPKDSVSGVWEFNSKKNCYIVSDLASGEGIRQSNLGWAKFDMKGNLIDTGTDWITRPNKEELIRAQKDVKKFTTLWKEKKPSPQNIYLRFGRSPRKGVSTHIISGKKEKGISVYEIKQDIYGRHFLELSDYKFPYLGYVLRKERPAYIVKGKRVGTGSDGEPLLQNVKIVKKLSSDEVAAIYGEQSAINIGAIE